MNSNTVYDLAAVTFIVVRDSMSHLLAHADYLRAERELNREPYHDELPDGVIRRDPFKKLTGD